MSFFGEISAKEHCGLRLMLRLAKTYQTKKPVSLATISSFEKISVKYLEQLVAPFRQAGWLKSVRGCDGGYLMIKNPARISLKEVFYLLEDQPYLVSCLAKNKNHQCAVEKNCPSKKGLQKIQQAINLALDKITLAELIK